MKTLFLSDYFCKIFSCNTAIFLLNANYGVFLLADNCHKIFINNVQLCIEFNDRQRQSLSVYCHKHQLTVKKLGKYAICISHYNS